MRSNAEQCGAMRSNAEQCGAMRSNAEQCGASTLVAYWKPPLPALPLKSRHVLGGGEAGAWRSPVPSASKQHTPRAAGVKRLCAEHELRDTADTCFKQVVCVCGQARGTRSALVFSGLLRTLVCALRTLSQTRG